MSDHVLHLGDCLAEGGLASLRARFDAKHEPEPNTGCWLWTGSVNADGYGHIGFRRRVWKAHRAAWLLFVGEIPGGRKVLHRCDNPPCVNPAHLWLGSDQDNASDKARKGRAFALRGQANPKAKLTDAAVREIRRLVGQGMSASAAGRLFGVSVSAACRVARGDSWK